jgi:hypothetical protein
MSGKKNILNNDGGPGDYPGSKPNQLLARVDVLRRELAGRNPFELARLSGSSYLEQTPGCGVLTVKLWERPVHIGFPDWIAVDPIGKRLNPALQALLAYYFVKTDGTTPVGKWISFAELPDGRFYAQAYQGYTGAELARRFGNDIEKFTTAAQAAGGQALTFGDRAFQYWLLPRVSLAAVYWQGDEDFYSNCQVLFDATAPHHLPTDACAIAGSMLARMILSG